MNFRSIDREIKDNKMLCATLGFWDVFDLMYVDLPNRVFSAIYVDINPVGTGKKSKVDDNETDMGGDIGIEINK